MARILFVLTAADTWTLADGTAHPTGFWAEEAVAPYREFTAAGHDVVVATPGAAVPTVDGASLTPDVNGGPEGAADMAAGLAAFTELGRPMALADVDLADYAAVFYPGGHGPMEDLAVDQRSGALLTEALDSGRPLGVVCHAPAAMLASRRVDGSWPFAGYRMTAFTDAEERQTGLADKAKWLLQDRLVELGADFREGEPWASHIVMDRNLYTGQNPASSGPLAAAMLKTLD